jgi:hypothetical protein
MTTNNLANTDVGASDEPTDSNPRDHAITIAVTADEFAELERMVPALKERLNRRIIPIATAAYEVFRRGLEQERAAA